jgi:hypothetical protein
LRLHGLLLAPACRKCAASLSDKGSSPFGDVFLFFLFDFVVCLVSRLQRHRVWSQKRLPCRRQRAAGARLVSLSGRQVRKKRAEGME